MPGKWQCGECQQDLTDDGKCPNSECRVNRLKWSNSRGKADHPEDKDDRR